MVNVRGKMSILEDPTVTPNMFLSRALQKILSERDVKRKENAQLKQACETALAALEEELQADGRPAQASQVGPDSPMPPPHTKDKIVTADKYFIPFKLACECKSAKVVRISLDCLQKLMAYGHINGTMLTEVDGFTVRLVDQIVETVCKCFTGDSTDEQVQVQIIKALLTAVNSSHCEVHEGMLLKAVRTCYNIYLTSKYPVNQTTAKGTLTQMISVIFQRNEAVAAAAAKEAGQGEVAEGADDTGGDAGASLAGASTLEGESVVDDDGNDVPPSPDAGEGGASQVNGTEEAEQQKGEAETAEEYARRTVMSIIDAAIDGEAVSAEEVGDAVASDQTQGEAPPMERGNSHPEDLADRTYGHVYRKDAYLVFRSMCKLSMKDLSDKEADSKSHELKSKLLSLELQLAILQAAGPAFCNDGLFIDGIKQYLCVALSKNGVSHVPDVFERSLSIFLVLLNKFQHHLKMEIEVFFKEILLSMLETSLSSFQHKWLVVACLSKITSNPQMMVDIYLNFDCDEYLENIFVRMVNDISRVAQGRASSELGATQQQEHNIKLKGLECLVAIMRGMKQWVRPLVNDGMQSEAASINVETTEAESSINELQQFETRKERKELREQAIQLFNRKPKKGIAAMQKAGFVGPDATDVAKFLHEELRLDKAAIGEYLGEGEEFPIEVMHCYVDMTDLETCTSFLDALRHFLGSFRLPGEAQKIDRIMEKFAARYFETFRSHGIFASADAAYVLAYSIIMLTTDLHSAKVKNKITKEGFVKMTRGINDNKDLPRDFVEAIYDDIAKQEIRLKGGQAAPRPQAAELQNARARQALYNVERRAIAETAEEAMARAISGKANRMFLTATHAEHARPMFKEIWTSLMAAFTVPLNDSVDPVVIDLCLEGIQHCIHIACIFGLDLEREAFVPTLAKFTSLSNPAMIKYKNVEAIRCLLHVACAEGDYLGSSWKDILAAVSQLEHAQIVSSGGKKGRSDTLSDTASQDIVVAVDKIFTSSRNLSGEAVVDFVRALCEVSSEELHAKPPRLYSLAKTVEIAYYNMERIRLEWAHIWQVMGEHFNSVGCLPNTDIAFFAVDSLRQLSMKFLEKGELANYSFQKDFLRPFEYIMSHNKQDSIRDMVVRCVAQMVQSKATNIRSGWKNMFFVFALAAADSDQGIVNLAFTTTQHVFETLFNVPNDHRASLIASSFMDAVNCLAEFACNAHFPDLSMSAIKQLRTCAQTVSEVPELFVNPQEESGEEPQIWVKGWFPVLFGLSRIINRCKMDVRTRALTVMFEIMKTYGDRFLPQWWTDLFRVVFRTFNDKKLQDMSSAQERNEWMSTTCTHTLRSIVDVVSQFFDTVQDCVVVDLLGLLRWCCTRDNEPLARAGAECLHILVMNNGNAFTDSTWDHTVDTLAELFETTRPVELFRFGDKAQSQPPSPTKQQDGDAQGVEGAEQEAQETKKEKPSEKQVVAARRAQQQLFSTIVIKSVVQLELIQTVEWIVLSSTQPDSTTPKRFLSGVARTPTKHHCPASAARVEAEKLALSARLDIAGEMFVCLSSPRLLKLLDCLLESHQFAHDFNSNVSLRTALWQAGFMKNRSKPNLFKQETMSLGCAIRIMFRIYESDDRKEVHDEVEERLLSVCTNTLDIYLTTVSVETRDIWTPLLCLIIREIMNMNDERFEKHATAHYEALCECITLSFDSKIDNLAFYLPAFFNRTRALSL
eukprot:m.13862 g.13862  ORF g.13862 m.13862 type:complete len:1705 (+) comp6055_c0_seq1:251-5365(+)